MTQENKMAEEIKEKPKPKKVKVVKEESKKSHVSEEKKQAVKTLAEKIKASKTIMLVSIKSLPSPQLQKIKKDLRNKAEVQIIKKSILIRAIDATGIPELAGLKEHIEADNALALSDDDAFELAAWLSENRNPIAAKTGQEATDDINIEAGPTDLMPGPDISALGNVGLQVGVEAGKIAIKKAHIILKQGGIVTENIASVLLKLGIKPFMIGLNPTIIYDSVSKKIYVGVKIDKDEALNSLLTAQGRALGLARGLKIITKDTIGYLLAKANAEASSLAPTGIPSEDGKKLAPAEPVAEEPKEEVKEEAASSQGVPSEDGKEKKDDTENKSEEESK